MLRAAGDNDGADELVLELDEIDSTSGDDESETPVVVVEVESAGESGDGVVTMTPPAGETETVIEAEAAATIAVIEAQTDAQIAVMKAAAEIEAAAEKREADAAADVVIVADATTDPDPDPEPRTSHPFYRPLFGRRRD